MNFEYRFIIVVLSTEFSTDALYVMHCYYMFRPTGAIIRYIQFYAFATPPYTGQCLHIGSVLFGYIVYVMPLCYKIY
jgi:hypothetical protein